MPRLERVFGLSINEEVQWGTALADLDAGVIHEGYENGTLCDIPEGNRLPWHPDDKLFLEERISEGLVALHRKRPELFDEATRIGISCIGIVNRQERLLVSVARKNWVTRKVEGKDRPFLVDFKSLFLVGGPSAMLFPRIKKLDQIVAQNDAPARCLTEYLYGYERNTQPDSLLYLMAGEGVNGAIVLSGDFPAMIGHPEFGHCTPQLHPDDEFFLPAHSGCPTHKRCFEGLISNARFRQQWDGHNLWELHPNHRAWDIASWYLAQMAMTGTLLLDPAKIIFGGEIFYGSKGLALIEKVREKYTELNAGYLPHHKTLDDAKDLIGRASIGSAIWVLSALTMASPPRNKTTTTREVAENVYQIGPYLAQRPRGKS